MPDNSDPSARARGFSAFISSGRTPLFYAHALRTSVLQEKPNYVILVFLSFMSFRMTQKVVRKKPSPDLFIIKPAISNLETPACFPKGCFECAIIFLYFGFAIVFR